MKSVNKRGLSPVIATVLLVLIVIILGSIIFVAFRGLTKEAVQKFGQNIELTCGDVNFNAEMDGNTITISNQGNVAIYDFQIKIDTSTGYSLYKASEKIDNWDADQGLLKGRSISGEIRGYTIGEVTLTPILLGSADKGLRTFVCGSETSQVAS
jgi:flagellin-like protein